MNVAKHIIRILEANQVKYVFGLPGEEIIPIMDAIQDSDITFVTARHEQGAGFMADVYSRITKELTVCLATLGPGATNFATPAADAFLDFAPVLFLTGQAERTRLYKNSHQVIDTKAVFDPITKWSGSVITSDNITEVIQNCIKIAKTHPMGAVHLVIPEDVQKLPCSDCKILKVQFPQSTYPNEEQLKRAQTILSKAKRPVVIAGNGIFREEAHHALKQFCEALNIPVVETYMGKGSLPNSHPMFVGALGLPWKDPAYTLVAESDVVITIGYDLVELEPKAWNPNSDKSIIHIGSRPAEVDQHYVLEVGIQGQIDKSLSWLQKNLTAYDVHDSIRLYKDKAREDIALALSEKRFPLSPAFVIHQLADLLTPKDIVISDVGAHKIWMGRLFPCEVPGRCIISNGLATMGIALPGAIGAALADPEARVVSVNGDGGFLMNVQELETATRLNLPIIHIVFNDSLYGLIKWKQYLENLPPSQVDFTNPDFVKLAESFGAKGLRIKSFEDVRPVLVEALSAQTQVIIDCPVDFEENIRLVQRTKK